MSRIVPTGRWYYPAAIGIVAVAGIVATVYTYSSVSTSTKEALLADASAIAYALAPEQIMVLSGTQGDSVRPEYHALKERLMNIRATQEDIRFVYLVGHRDGEPFFFMDSESPDSSDYSPPGQVFYEAGPAFREPFISGRTAPAMEGIMSDRWGMWLTAVVPIVDSETRTVVALMGMDMAADTYHRTVLVHTLIPAAVTAAFIALLAISYIIRRREQQIIAFRSELVAIASHEIRTPLVGISWLAESLLKKSITEELKEDIRLIHEQSRRLLATVNDFLELSAAERIETQKLNREQVPIRALFEELSEQFTLPLKEKSLHLEFEESLTPDVSLTGDKERLRRAFSNLISNAIKYSKQDGTIAIGCELRARQLVLWVRDEGIGVPQQDQAKIFEGFYRAKNAKEATRDGTGLGLRYVQQVARMHDGRVWVQSEEGKGSTFYVEFPA